MSFANSWMKKSYRSSTRSLPQLQNRDGSERQGAGESVKDEDLAVCPNSPVHTDVSYEEPTKVGQLFIVGINASEDGLAISSFVHFFTVLCNIKFHGGIPRSFAEALKRVSAPADRDFVYVWQLRSSLVKIIAGDYFGDLQLENKKSIFDIMRLFPAKVKDRVSVDIEEGGEDIARARIEALKIEHEKGIEESEVYLVSVNVLRFWLDHTTMYRKPLSTLWQFWGRGRSKQMLGEAIAFKLCIMHSMTCKAFAEHGRTDRKSLQSYIHVHH